jgi:hypothetical protein
MKSHWGGPSSAGRPLRAPYALRIARIPARPANQPPYTSSAATIPATTPKVTFDARLVASESSPIAIAPATPTATLTSDRRVLAQNRTPRAASCT